MATLAQRTQTLEQRTDRLESILASFMERTDSSIERLERAIERMEQEGARDREAAARDREESARFRAEMARDREEMKQQADRERREFDALYVGTRAVLLNETKSSPRMSDCAGVRGVAQPGRRARPARRTIRADMNMNYTIDTVEDLVRILDEHPQWLDALRARLLPPAVLRLPEQLAELAARVEEIAEQTKRFQAATEQRFDRMDQRFDRMDQRFDRMDQRLGRVEARLDRVIDDLGPLKGAHAGNVAVKEASLIALDLGLRYRKSLTSMELVSLSDAVDTTDVAANELRSFHRADVIVEAADREGERCYAAVEASYTVNGRDTARAIRNAGLLSRFTGRRSYAVVAGLRRDDRIQDRVDAGEVLWYQLTPEAMQAD